MLIVALIAFGYASTMPRGPQEAEYLRVFGYDPSWYGIVLIFMISGYLTMRSLMRHGSGLKMLTSRIGRTLPILAIFAFSVVFLIYPLFGTHTGGLTDSLRYLFNVLSCLNPNALTPGLLDNALYACIIQGGLWTFRWGVIAFVLAALGWQTGVLKSPKFVLGISGFALALYVGFVAYNSVNPGALNPDLGLALRMGWPFLMGMSAYIFRDKLPKHWGIPIGLTALAAIQQLLLPWTPLIEITFDLALGYLVFLAINSKVAPPKPLQKIPDLSLGIYVFNWPVSQLSLLVIPTLSPLALFGLGFPITVAIALGLWWMVNRPINQDMNGFTAVTQPG